MTAAWLMIGRGALDEEEACLQHGRGDEGLRGNDGWLVSVPAALVAAYQCWHGGHGNVVVRLLWW